MQARGVVAEGIANLYGSPSAEVDLVTQSILGTSLSIEESREGWLHVLLPDRYPGWIEARHVRFYAPGEPAYASAGQVIEVQSLMAFLYHGPDGTARAPALVATLSARLEMEEEQQDWIGVTLPDGAQRWMRRGDAVVVPAGSLHPRQSVEQVLRTARRFLGLPYLWGGTTPLGIDCSGFVQLVYHLNGAELPRDSRMQYAQPDLAPVEREELETGDLLYFGSQRVSHVGLYVGRGEFIHATAHRVPVVQISRLDEPHWTGLYLGARRP
jgi:gamma-D-glutamyl-L-lysine dipeptidyl-peptidase